MTTAIITLIISTTLAIIGLALELSSRTRKRQLVQADGKTPSFTHRNLRLMGVFRYKNGTIHYHSYCFGPLPIIPIGCYSCGGNRISDVTGTQKANLLEILSLYLRWGWVVALVSLTIILF